MIRNTNDDDDDPDDSDRRKTSSQTMKKYRLGFQQRRDVDVDVDVDVDDGTSSNNPIIALPVGKIIGRNPKNPVDAQKHITELGTILSFKKKSNGSCSNIPRKLFGITSNTSSCVTLKVIFVKGKPPTNIHKLVKYCSKPKNNNNNNNAKRQQEKRLVEHRFTSDTKELVLKPNDILKIQDHTFHIVPCPDTPEDDEEEDQENDEAEEEMKPSSSLSSSSSKTSTAFSGANKNTNLSSLPKSNSKSNTIMRGWTPPTTTIPSFSVGSVGDSTIEMDSIASSTTLLSSSVSSSSSTKKRKSPTIQKVSRTTITTTAPQKKKKIMNNNDDARMMIPSPSEPEPKKVKKTSTTIISTKANIGKDDEEVISSDDDDEVISLPTQKMKKFTSAAVTAAATKNNSIINNKIKSNDDINKKKNDVTIGSKNTKKRDNPSPLEDTTNATTKKNDNNNNKTQRRSEEEDIVKVKGESHDTTTASTTTTSLRRSTRSRRAPIEIYKTDTVRRYDNNDESSVASSSCCISTTTSTTTTTTKKKKKMKQQQQQKQPSLPPKSLISSSSSSNTNKTVSKAKADKIMNQHVKKIEETREQKEQILKDGDIVLAEYHVDKSYYWGKIISTQHIPRKGVRYHVRFQDGDESPSVAADCLSRGILYVELIKNGWWAENLPPKEYLDELELFSSNAKQKERDGDDIYIAKKKTNHVNEEEEEEEEEPDENKSSIAPSIRRSKRARAPAIREEEEEEEEMAMTKTASNQKVAAASVLAKSKMSNQKKDVPIRFDFPTSNFIPPMDKEGQILLPPGVEPFVPTMSFFHMIPEEKLSNNNDPAVAAKRQQNETQEEAEDTERILKKIPARLSSSPLKGATAAAARTTDDDEDDDEDHDIDGMAEEDDDDDDERGPRDMHVSLAKVYWKALNSPQPHLGSQFFQMLLSQNRLPETRLCNDLVQLLTKGPELGDYAFYDGHRLNLAFEYVEKVVEKFPSIMMPRFAEAAGGEYWKSSLDYLTTLPYGNNDVSTALNLHNFNLKLLNLLLRGLLLLDDGSHSLPLLRDMRAYGLSAVCRYCCQTMASVWTKYGHYIWEHGDGEDDLVCPLTVELTNRLSDIVVQLMDHFKIPMNDRVEMLWDSMNVQIQAAPSERREDENWVRQLKMYWIPSLLMIEHEASPQHWEDLCIKLARCADVEELVTMMGMGIR